MKVHALRRGGYISGLGELTTRPISEQGGFRPLKIGIAARTARGLQLSPLLVQTMSLGYRKFGVSLHGQTDLKKEKALRPE